MRRTLRSNAAAAVAFALAASATTVGLAHDSPNDGHIPKDANYGFDLIGRDTLAGVADGLYTDVWSHKGFAYVGTFQEPSCDRSGVFIVNIDSAVANYPDTSGAVVAEI